MTARPSSQLWVMPLSVLLIAFGAFVVLAIAASDANILPGDEPIIDAVQRLPESPWRAVAKFGNILGATPTTPIVLVWFIVLSLMRRSATAVAFCSALLVLRFAAMALKSIFDSPRPNADHAFIRESFDGLGFPSGHMVTATIVAGAITIVMRQLFPGTRYTRLVIGFFWIWAIACGFARIWYGAHWPTDVLGGFLAGIVLLGVSSRLAKLSSSYVFRTK